MAAPVQTLHYENSTFLESQRRKPEDRSRKIEVIGAGFSRTATCSFTLALQKLLQGPVCHGAYVKGWIRALDPANSKATTKQELHAILDGYLGVTDFAGFMVIPELLEMYPDAKVIVTTRDPEKWWESYTELVTLAPWWLGYFWASLPTLRYLNPWLAVMKKKGRSILPAGTAITGPEYLDVHDKYIRRVVPPERLFFFDVKEGWEPLCKILDVSVPDEPFPHVNDRLALKAIFRTLMKKAALLWVLYSLPLLLAFWYFNQPI